MSNYCGQAAIAFERVEKKPFWDGWRKIFARKPNKLLSFSAVEKILNLQHNQDMGVQEIAIDDIVGSLGRYNEFDRTFKPKHDFTEDRLRRVAESYYHRGFDPIEVFKVSNVYFVVDGNHRISVSRAFNIKTIFAHIYEYKTPITLDIDDDLKSICIKWLAANSVSTLEKIKTHESRAA